jgi:Family of unknown function (DUF6000)
MPFSKLWTKLFAKNTERDEIALHVSGATVRHKSLFEDLDVPRNDGELEEEFVEEWVLPFYTNSLSNADGDTINQFSSAAQKIDIDTVQRLLGDFNWRTRIAGAYFAAINNYKELLDVIGRHLLKSEVCYAGQGYCLALAAFGGDEAKHYLSSYLDYYLERRDLFYDQSDAFCALEYLDKRLAEARVEKWNVFVANKPYWDLNRSRDTFAANMGALEKIRSLKSNNTSPSK